MRLRSLLEGLDDSAAEETEGGPGQEHVCCQFSSLGSLSKAWLQVQYPIAAGESVITCPSPLNVLKDAYDHSCL
jgi:hypothetical protein